MNRRFTETMFEVFVAAAAVPERLRFGQRCAQRLFHHAGNPQLQQFDSEFRNVFRRHDGDATVEFLVPQHLIDVSISRQKAVLLAEVQSALDLQIANCGQQDFVRMRRLYIEQVGWHARSLNVLRSRSIQDESYVELLHRQRIGSSIATQRRLHDVRRSAHEP